MQYWSTIWSTLQAHNKICLYINYLWKVKHMNWSGRRDSNSRHSRWQRDALPLSYARLIVLKYNILINSIKEKQKNYLTYCFLIKLFMFSDI